MPLVRMASTRELLKSVKLVIFDYDGVIYNMIEPLREMVIEGTQKFNLKSNGLQTDMEEIFRVLEFALRRSVADQILDAKEMLEIHLLEGYPLLRRLRIAAFFYGHFREKTKEPHLFEGVIELVKLLHKRGIQMAIFSNSAKKYIQTTLDQYHILRYFSQILGAAEVSKVKPDPEGILKILSSSGIKPQHAVYLGDMVSDIEAGKSAQVPVIAIASGIVAREKLSAADPLLVVDDLQELLPLFGA